MGGGGESVCTILTDFIDGGESVRMVSTDQGV